MLDVPEVVRNKALLAGAEGWLAGLSDLVADLEEEWGIAVGRPYADPTEAYITEATLSDGSPGVLKLVVPRDGMAATREITALELAKGEGCVRLRRSDAERGALLLERLGRSLFELGLPISRRHQILCDTVTKVWRPAPECGLPTGAEKATWLKEFIATTWEQLNQPCSERAVAYAIECADRRIKAHSDERAVLVHGDVHQWNTLEAETGFKLIDPDGLLAEAEYDMGIIMREDPEELLHGDPRERARWLAHRTHLDQRAIWEWGVVERVSTGLLGLQVGFGVVGGQMLEVADLVVPNGLP